MLDLSVARPQEREATVNWKVLYGLREREQNGESPFVPLRQTYAKVESAPGPRRVANQHADRTRAPGQVSDETETDRPPDFPLSEWQLGVENAVGRLTGRIRHTGRSAFVHLRKAWALHGIDDEMSAFRAITAEEEAATALILALQRQRYPGAGQLNTRNHVHKNAFWPLIATISDFLFKSGISAPKVTLSRNGPPRLEIHINMTALAGGDGEDVWATPDEPLNFGLRSGDVGQEIVHRFEDELAALADAHGRGSILKYIESEANQRNLLLYASDGGIPNATFQDEMLIERGKRVCVLLAITIAVLQTTVHQIFAVQCLEALLVALNRVQGVLGDPTAMAEVADRPKITIQRRDSGPATVSLSRSFDFQATWLEVKNWPKILTASPAGVTYGRPQFEAESRSGRLSPP